MVELTRIAVFALCLAGCAGMEYPTDPADRAAVAAGTRVTHDAYQQVYEANGPMILDQDYFRTVEECGGLTCNHASSLYALRARDKDRSFADSGAQLYIEARFNADWAFLESAWSDGRQLPLTVIDRQVRSCDSSRYVAALGCDLTETVGIDLTRSELEAMTVTGLDAKIQGSRDSFVIQVPASYFGGFLDAMGRQTAP